MSDVLKAVECPECAGTGVCCAHDPCHQCGGDKVVWRLSVPLPLYGRTWFRRWFGCIPGCGQRFKTEREYEAHYRREHD